MKKNMDQILQATVRRNPQHAAILEHDRTISYAELNERIATTAGALEAAGVQRGDAVGLHVGSGVEYIVLNYAIWRLGCVTVPIATELAVGEKEELCRNIRLEHVLSPPGPLKFAVEFVRGEPVVINARTTLFHVESPVDHPAGFEAVNAAFIRFTSGTTGQSKGVVLSHETIDERIRAANELLKIGPEDRIMWLLSMSYHFTVSIVAYLSFGASIILPRNNLAAAVVEACEKHRATLLYGSPMHCALMADYPKGKPIESLRIAISTTTAIGADVEARFEARYGVPIAQALGLIEIGLPCINVQFAGRKHGSVGQVLPAYELRMDDVGFGPDMLEIFFRGPGFLDAYYRPWRPRSEILKDGWFATHDVGMRDADGCLFLRGRSKEVISVAGMKFFPQEVEGVLARHPNVREAAVYAAPHDRTGEVPRARVVLRQASDANSAERELRAYCAANLASYKVPEKFEFVTELPKTASGKVLHRAKVS